MRRRKKPNNRIKIVLGYELQSLVEIILIVFLLLNDGNKKSTWGLGLIHRRLLTCIKLVKLDLPLPSSCFLGESRSGSYRFNLTDKNREKRGSKVGKTIVWYKNHNIIRKGKLGTITIKTTLNQDGFNWINSFSI